LSAVRDALLSVPLQAVDLDRRYMTDRFRYFLDDLGPDDIMVREALQDRTPETLAEHIVNTSVLVDVDRTVRAMEEGSLTMTDPAVRAAAAFLPRLIAFQDALDGIRVQEQEIARLLGRARFAIHGTSVPPDATFSPRFTDGVVRGYPYNGTMAPAYTTFYGLYERHYAFGAGTEWDLPARWLAPPQEFAHSTPLNFVTTSDTIGGNSGSPVVSQHLEIVGINFDRNIEGLSREYIYLTNSERNMAVDVRAIQEALGVMYNADRIVFEVTTGRLATETEADIP
jgi:hypothetical protein